MMVLTCNHSTWKVEARRSEVQGQPQLQREFQASQGYLRPISIKKNQREGEKRRDGREYQVINSRFLIINASGEATRNLAEDMNVCLGIQRVGS